VGSLCFTGVQQCISGALRGAGNTLGAMVLTIIGVWGLQFPVAWYLSRHTALGFHGIWWSFVIANVLSALLASVWYLRGQWLARAPVAAPAGSTTATVPAPSEAA
jgi:Na+-driven multidrug efflux pump